MQLNAKELKDGLNHLGASKDHFNLMHFLYQKAVFSTIFTMHLDVGHLFDGIKLEQLLVKIVVCKWEVLQCCYHVESHYFLVLNLFAVQNILKVGVEFLCFVLTSHDWFYVIILFQIKRVFCLTCTFKFIHNNNG